MTERAGSELTTVKSDVALQPFALEEGLYPLNAYFDFAPEDRKMVMVALHLAAAYLPTADEYYVAQQEGGPGEWRMEKRYGAVADAYARAIDPNFSQGLTTSESPSEQKRERFYRMIRTLTAEQVYDGLLRIVDIVAKKPSTPQE